MRRFRVVVNGLAYEVVVEELTEEAEERPASPVRLSEARAEEPQPQPVRKVAEPVRPVAPPSQPVTEGLAVQAPLPGTVLAVKVAPGDLVGEGQVLVILEAMKMENEIMAPEAGRVLAVQVEPGRAVNVGDVLVRLGKP